MTVKCKRADGECAYGAMCEVRGKCRAVTGPCRRFVLIAIIPWLLAIGLWSTPARATECARSPDIVLAAHPAGHAVYVTRDGAKCWMLDKRRTSVARVKPAAAPVPRPRPVMAAEFAQALTPQQLIDNAFIAVGWNQ